MVRTTHRQVEALARLLAARLGHAWGYGPDQWHLADLSIREESHGRYRIEADGGSGMPLGETQWLSLAEAWEAMRFAMRALDHCDLPTVQFDEAGVPHPRAEEGTR